MTQEELSELVSNLISEHGPETCVEIINELRDQCKKYDKTLLNGGDDVNPEIYKNYMDDIIYIKSVLIKHGYLNAGLRDAVDLWDYYSESMAAGWMGVDHEDDEGTFYCIEYYIEKLII